MLALVKRLSLPALVSVIVIAESASSAFGQASNFRVAPSTANQAAYAAGANHGSKTGYRSGFNVGAMSGGGYGAGYYPPSLGPTGGYLAGAADVIGAQGQYAIDFQQGKLVKEQVNSAKIDNKKKQIDEWLYERAVLPTTEDERERNMSEQLRRSRNDPPVTEIWSGKAVNELLVAIQKALSQRAYAPDVPLAEDVVQHINVTSGATTGSIGLLKENGKLSWPLSLRRGAFTDDRKKMDELAAQALKEAASGEVSADTLDAMTQCQKSMEARLKGQIEEISPNDYVKGKRYIGELENTIKALQDPNVSMYASRKWADRVDSVGNLIVQMTKQGLKFAPAVSGDQAAYVALHSGMVTFYDGFPPQLTAPPPKKIPGQGDGQGAAP